MDFGKTVLLFISVLLIAWWIGTIMKAEGKDKLEEACHPISFVMEHMGEITEGLVGFRPKWTIKTRQILEGGCYYFASVVILGGEEGEEDEGEEGEVKGGLHR